MNRDKFVKIVNYVQIVPVVQLYPIQPAAHTVHDPFVCRHVSGLQLGEHSREQSVPKYPLLQARD